MAQRAAMIITALSWLIMMSLFFVSPSPAMSQEAKLVVQGSGLPVPRFVTLKSDKVNMRVGPGREYQLTWVYTKRH